MLHFPVLNRKAKIIYILRFGISPPIYVFLDCFNVSAFSCSWPPNKIV